MDENSSQAPCALLPHHEVGTAPLDVLAASLRITLHTSKTLHGDRR